MYDGADDEIVKMKVNLDVIVRSNEQIIKYYMPKGPLVYTGPLLLIKASNPKYENDLQMFCEFFPELDLSK